MLIKAFTLDAFAKSIGGGNPAGVVLNADSLSETEMKQIAEVIGFSETAFVMKSDNADFKVRFFTPSDEVDLCGHATIGTFYTMADQGIIPAGKYKQETKAGILAVEVGADYTVLMEQNLPQFFEVIDKEEIAESLNISIKDIMSDLPVQIVSTGLKDIIIPIKSLDCLNSIKPDFGKVEAISRKYNVIGYHIFTLGTLHNSTAHCRNLAPLYGIPEESATGTSNGALSCYLHKYGKLDDKKLNAIKIEQGYSMGKPSEILVSLSADDGMISQVKVGGKALNLKQREIEL